MLTEILLLLALQTVLFVWSWGLEENHRLTLVERDIYLSDLSDELEGLTILQVSDLHDCAYGKDGRELMALASTLPYDFMAVTGDLFDRHHPARCKNALNFAAWAVQRGPVYFCEGNHEQNLPLYERQYREKLKKLGVILLENTHVIMQTGGCQWTLAGVQDRVGTDVLKHALSGPGFRLLLAHRPEDLPRYAAAGASLVLSGHGHGGQWCLLGRGIYAPGQGFFPRYTKGVYCMGRTAMHVSSGAGSHKQWIPRFFNPPCIELLTLHRG